MPEEPWKFTDLSEMADHLDVAKSDMLFDSEFEFQLTPFAEQHYLAALASLDLASRQMRMAAYSQMQKI